tara:strand:- start:1158 stop:2030 length:873 start_codon:yes stop_codon:yes gene_type:complete
MLTDNIYADFGGLPSPDADVLCPLSGTKTEHAGRVILNMAASLILQEQPLQVLPTLARLLGLEQAVVLQQLYWLLQNPRNGKVLGDGERYIFNTYEGWQVIFPWLSERSLRRVFGELEDRGIVMTCQPDGSFSRRKYYRVLVGAVAKLTYEAAESHLTFSSDDAAKKRASKRPESALPLTESSNTEITTTPSGKGRDTLLDALVSQDGSNPLQVTASAFGAARKALKDIRAVMPDVTPEEISRRGSNYRVAHPDWTITPLALSKYWAACEKPPMPKVSGLRNAPLTPVMR